jgi:hypothetical protein
MLVLAGLLGGVSWAVEWLSRRQIVDVPLARIVFPSGQLPGLLYLFAIATALTGGRRSAVWALLAGVILGLFLITGTRSSLLLLIGPLAMVALIGRARIGLALRSVVLHGVSAAVVLLAFQFALALPVLLETGRSTSLPGSPNEPGGPGRTPPTVPTIVDEHIGSLPGLVENPAADPSVKERVAQYEAAWALIRSSPIVGVGPGHSIEWVNVSGHLRSGYTADTPLVMPAKFGLLGVIVFSGTALAYAMTLQTALRRDRRSAVSLTLVGFGLVLLVTLPLGFAVEDKGASFALILLLALAFAEPAPPLSVDSTPSGEVHAQASRGSAPKSMSRLAAQRANAVRDWPSAAGARIRMSTGPPSTTVRA